MGEAERALNILKGVKDIGFVEFTTSLIEGVFDTLVKSSIDQMKAFSEYVSAVAGGIAKYKEDALGSSDEDKEKTAKDYIYNEFGIKKADDATNDTVEIEDAQYGLIISTLGLKNAGAIESAGLTMTAGATTNDPSTYAVDLVKLTAEVKNFLISKTEDSYKLLTMIVQTGAQRILVDTGHLVAKMTFNINTSETRDKTSTNTSNTSTSSSFGGGLSGGASKILSFTGIGSLSRAINGSIGGGKSKTNITVNVVNEKTTGAINMNAQIIGEVLINFRSDFFPSYTPPPQIPAKTQ